MPQTTAQKVTRSYLGGHPDRSAARIARKLVRVHGHFGALVLVTVRYDRHAAAYNLGGLSAERLTYWRTVLGILARNAPLEMHGERTLADVERAVAAELAAEHAA
jgi:hypothetical protein